MSHLLPRFIEGDKDHSFKSMSTVPKVLPWQTHRLCQNPLRVVIRIETGTASLHLESRFPREVCRILIGQRERV